MNIERQSTIRQDVQSITTTTPRTDTADMFWHQPFRGDNNYYRLVVNDEPQYDVWIETTDERDKIGDLHVTIEVVVYDVQAQMKINSTTIVNKAFDGHQPSEQMFLVNLYHYKEQAKETLEMYAKDAEFWAEKD